RKLYLRARDYGLRALIARHPGLGDRLRHEPRAAVRILGKRDVPAAYWTPASCAAAIGVSKDQPDTVAEQPQVEALIDRAAQFDSLLKQAIAIDADARPEWRLSNLIYQRRARWLLSQEDELFVETLHPALPNTSAQGAH